VEAKNSPAKLLGAVKRQFFTVPSGRQDHPRIFGITAADFYSAADPLPF